MQTEAPTAGTNPTDTAAVAAPDAAPNTLLTADPAAAAPATDPAVTGDAPAGDAQAGSPAEGDKPAEAAKPEEKPQGAPEEYADFILPEGTKANPDAIAELKAFAKEKNLSQEDAQKLVDLGVKNSQSTVEALNAQIEQVRKDWVESSRTDKEFGGDKLDENRAVAKRALDAFGTPELSTLLEQSGLGDHPEVIRAFFRVGKAISEDRLVTGTKALVSDPLKTMYPTMNS